MKKIFGLIFIACLILAGAKIARAHDVSSPLTSPAEAKVGDKVTITFEAFNSPGGAKKIYLYISDTLPKNPDEGKPYLKDAYDPPGEGLSQTFQYVWDTKAAQSNPGIHNIVVLMVDKFDFVLAENHTSYNLLPAEAEGDSGTNGTGRTGDTGKSNGSDTGRTGDTGTTGEGAIDGSDGTETNGPTGKGVFFDIAGLGTIEFWPTKVNSAEELIMVIINWLLSIMGGLAVIAIIYSGLMYITASGDTAKAEAAKKNLIWAITGVVVVALSFFLVNLVANIVGGK